MKTIAAKAVQGIFYTGGSDQQVTGYPCASGFSRGVALGCGRRVGEGYEVTRTTGLAEMPKHDASSKDVGGALKMEPYRMTIKKLLPIAAAALLLIGLAVTPAAADSITYNITVPNTALSSYPSPYASVYIDLTSSTAATITFTGLTTGAYTYILGTTSAADLNVNGTFSVTNITFTGGCTVSGCPAGGTGFTVGSGNVSGFGTFNLTLTNNDGYQDAVNSVTFTLTATGATTWSSASNVLIANSLGNFAAAHVFATGASCSGACVTGFASNGGGSFTPEPNTGLLLGFALFGLGFVFWRRGMLKI